MWVYYGDSPRLRLGLPSSIGYWLDYWLFLNSYETHPLWCVRPLGFTTLARAAFATNSDHDKVLREQLAQEVRAAAELARVLTLLPKAPEPPPLLANKWRQEWLDWLSHVTTIDRRSLIESVVVAIGRALNENNLHFVNYLTRRLAAELAEFAWPKGVVFDRVKLVLCDSGDFYCQAFSETRFVTTLAAALEQPAKRPMVVQIEFAPVVVPPRTARFLTVNPRAITQRNEAGEPILIGVEVDVDATHVDEAAAIALDAMRTFLEGLRLIAYVRTHPTGSIKVLDPINTGAGTDNCVRRPLPQPFWTGHYRRPIPRLPPFYDKFVKHLPEQDKENWSAAKWHLSQALSDWSEDADSAASHVWQALEAFCGASPDGWRKVIQLVPSYVDAAVPGMAEHLATGIRNQAKVYQKIDPPCDWYVWPFRTSLTIWLSRVMDHRSPMYYERWKRPLAPRVVFESGVGLLKVVARRLRHGNASPWMESRIASDLRLLYGLRNAVVHRGVRPLGSRTTMYLGQTGAEVLLALMNKKWIDMGGIDTVNAAARGSSLAAE